MKKLPLRLACCLAFAAFPASGICEQFCQRLLVDPEFPAGLAGQYEIVGREPQNGAAYTGTLALSVSQKVYTLTRTIQGKTVSGEAWVERCGPEKTMGLFARYATKPITEAGCSITTDQGNYYRLSCRTRQEGTTWSGLEAWFQNP